MSTSWKINIGNKAAGDFEITNEHKLLNVFNTRNNQQPKLLLNNHPTPDFEHYDQQNRKDYSLYKKLKEQWKNLIGTSKIGDEKGFKKLVDLSDNFVFDEGTKSITDICEILNTKYQNLVQERDDTLLQLKNYRLELVKLRQERKWLEKKLISAEREKRSMKDLESYRKDINISNEEILKDIKSETLKKQNEKLKKQNEELNKQNEEMKKQIDKLKKQNDELNKELLNFAIKKGESLMEQENLAGNNNKVNLICNCKRVASALYEQRRSNAEMQAYIHGILLKMVKYNLQVLEINHYD